MQLSQVSYGTSWHQWMENLFKWSGNMTEMAAMTIYGKIFLEKSSPEPKYDGLGVWYAALGT